MKCGNPEYESRQQSAAQQTTRESREAETRRAERGKGKGGLSRTEERKQLMCITFSSHHSSDRETKGDYSSVKTLDSLT